MTQAGYEGHSGRGGVGFEPGVHMPPCLSPPSPSKVMPGSSSPSSPSTSCPLAHSRPPLSTCSAGCWMLLMDTPPEPLTKVTDTPLESLPLSLARLRTWGGGSLGSEGSKLALGTPAKFTAADGGVRASQDVAVEVLAIVGLQVPARKEEGDGRQVGKGASSCFPVACPAGMSLLPWLAWGGVSGESLGPGFAGPCLCFRFW